MSKRTGDYNSEQIARGIAEHLNSRQMPNVHQTGNKVTFEYGTENKHEYTLEVVQGRQRTSLLFHVENPENSTLSFLEEALVPDEEQGKVSAFDTQQLRAYSRFFDFVDLRESQVVYGGEGIPTVVSVHRIKKIPQKTSEENPLKTLGDYTLRYIIRPLVQLVEKHDS